MEGQRQRSETRNSLRIDVDADRTISSQARTYAEYRVFAALTRSAGMRNARCARVVLRRLQPDAESSEVVCAVTVFSEDDNMRVRATGDHPYAAINRAVERLGTVTEPSSAERIPS